MPVDYAVLDHAILGFLQYLPFTGYELKKRFDTSIRHFWPADQSQIYRTLASLTKNGWADVEVIPQTNRPDRKVYTITPAGRDELHHWLLSPTPGFDTRSASLVQVFFAGQLSDEQILEKFEQEANGVRSLLELYRQLPDLIQEYIEPIHSPREKFFWMLTLEMGIRSMQTQLDWVESVIERIKKQDFTNIDIGSGG
jgi:PadR family transcriptional regulator, regulatory protein AphA